jgi:hypothetical protein
VQGVLRESQSQLTTRPKYQSIEHFEYCDNCCKEWCLLK